MIAVRDINDDTMMLWKTYTFLSSLTLPRAEDACSELVARLRWRRGSLTRIIIRVEWGWRFWTLERKEYDGGNKQLCSFYGKFARPLMSGN